jgi:hypothetical protein
MDIIKKIEGSKTDSQDRPMEKVVVADCGLFNDSTPAYEKMEPPKDEAKHPEAEEINQKADL